MPVTIRKKRKNEKGKKYKIIEVETGKVVAESSSLKNAIIAAYIRNKAYLKKARIVEYKGKKGIWITYKGKHIFIPLEKYYQYLLQLPKKR